MLQTNGALHLSRATCALFPGARAAVVLAVLTLLAATTPASAQCVSSSFTKYHVFNDLDMDGLLSLGDTLSYQVEYCEGAGNRRCSFSDVLPPELTVDPLTIACLTAPGEPVPDRCNEAAPGRLTVDFRMVRMAQNQCVTLVFTAMVNTAPTAPVCNQAVSDQDPADVTNDDCQAIVPEPDLALTKTAAMPVVAAGGAVDFTIGLTNVGSGPLVGGTLTDALDACWEPLGMDGAVCDPLVVRCAGTGCAGLTCTYSNGGLGFTLTGIDLASFDGVPGGDDEMTITVGAVAGVTPGACANTAETSDPSSPSLTAVAVVDIQVLAPDIDVRKQRSAPNVQAGGPVDFTIRVRNQGLGAIVAGELVDTMDPCWEPLGLDGELCDPLVVRCAGPGCGGATCRYTNGGLGFVLTGFALAPTDGMPAGPDEINVTVTATAGPTPGPCLNGAVGTDIANPTITDSDDETVTIIPAEADLEMSKTAMVASVPPTVPVDFDINVRNVGFAPLLGGTLSDVLDPCWEPLGVDAMACDPMVVRCSGPGCGAITCVYSNGGLGFTITGLDLAANDLAMGGGDEMTISVTAVAGMTLGDCTNTARTSDPNSPNLTADATVTIAPGRAMLELDKTARSGSVGIGGTVAFDVTLRNTGFAQFTGGDLTDVMAGCWEPLGPDAAPCDPVVVACAGPGCGAVTCVYSNGGLGFSVTGITLDANDLAPNGGDEMLFTIQAVAGTVTGPCDNQALATDPNAPVPLTADATVDIVSSAPCDLMHGDTAFPPVMPSIGSLYAASCGGGEFRLAVVNTPTATPGDLADDFVDMGGTLRLYQLQCGCSPGVYLFKNLVTGKVVLELF